MPRVMQAMRDISLTERLAVRDDTRSDEHAYRPRGAPGFRHGRTRGGADPDGTAAGRRPPHPHLQPRRRQEARGLGLARCSLDRRHRRRLRVRRRRDRRAGRRARAGRRVGPPRARLGQLGRHRQQAAHRPRGPRSAEARQRPATPPAVRGRRRRRDSGHRRAPRRHRRRSHRAHRRHSQRHLQLHPDQHGVAGRDVCRRARLGAVAGLCRGRSDRRRRRIRRARQAGDSLRRRPAGPGHAGRHRVPSRHRRRRGGFPVRRPAPVHDPPDLPGRAGSRTTRHA